MESNQLNSPDFLHKRQAKYTNYCTQKDAVLRSISNTSKTMLMVSNDTGIKRTNICPLIALLQKEGKVGFIGKHFCKVSTNKAGFYISTLKDS